MSNELEAAVDAVARRVVRNAVFDGITSPVPGAADTGSVSERSAQRGAITCSGCTAEWTGLGKAHCSGCHITFTGVSAFDRHRETGGEDEPHGFCHQPSVCGLVEREPGIWGAPAMTKEQIEKAWGPR